MHAECALGFPPAGLRPAAHRGNWIEAGPELCQQLCVCVYVLILVPGVGRLRSGGSHQGQMCNAVCLASVPLA